MALPYTLNIAVIPVTLADTISGSFLTTSSFWSLVTTAPSGSVSKSLHPTSNTLASADANILNFISLTKDKMQDKVFSYIDTIEFE